jgi:hypothetical protein
MPIFTGFTAGAIQYWKQFNSKNQRKKLIFLVLLIIVITSYFIIRFVYSKINLEKKNCTRLTKVYKQLAPLVSLTQQGPVDGVDKSEYVLRDFYIKTAYNCCCGGQFKNDFVSLCALSTCIKQGVRCLDFEIYSVHDAPVVAVSSVEDYTIKETYNSLAIEDIFQTIKHEAFSGGTCPNPNDPLILYFRIKSNNAIIYNKIAIAIKQHLSSNMMLNPEYSYEYAGSPNAPAKNLGAVPISKLESKIIIFIDGAKNKLYRSTKLDEYINMSSNGAFLEDLTYTMVKDNINPKLLDDNKTGMSIILPDLNMNDKNHNFNIPRNEGCQMIAMSFQNYDSNLEHYNEFFDSKKTAFVLKPANLRFIPVKVVGILPPDPSYTFKLESAPNPYAPAAPLVAPHIKI